MRLKLPFPPYLSRHGLMRKMLKAAKGIVSYAAALVFTVIFALYLSGRTGWFFFTVMVIYPLSSAVMAYITGRFLTVEAVVSENELYKGSKVRVRITVKNRAYLPSPPVLVEFFSSDALTCKEGSEKCTISVMPRSEQTAETECTANIWCAASAGIKSVRITDFTGLLKFSFISDLSKLSYKINIIPDIIDVPSTDSLIKNVNDAASQADDSEGTRDARLHGFNGTPGYDHREYIPGDPIKRINWKLSCKKNNLMVRLDDEIISSRHTVVLDAVNSSGKAVLGECCGENMLGMLKTMARIRVEADVWYYSEKSWKCCEITDENDVEQLRFALAGYEFLSSLAERIPSEEISSHGKCSSLLLYTPCYDKAAAAQFNIGKASSKTETSVSAAAASVGEGVDASGVWLLSADGNSEIIL